MSQPIFWQAATLINGDEKTKSINFLSQLEKTESAELRETLPSFFTLTFALSPLLPDLIYSHKTALRYLKLFLGLYVDVHHYDSGGELHEPDAFKTLLDTCKVLLWDEYSASSRPVSDEDHKNLFSFDYWVKKSGDWATDEVTNFSAQIPLRVLVPQLIKKLRDLRQMVFKSKYYWRSKDRPYLRLVYETVLPADETNDTLTAWGYNFDRHQHQIFDFNSFANMKYAELKKAGIKI